MNKKELTAFNSKTAPALKISGAANWKQDHLEITFDLYGDLEKISIPKQDPSPRRVIGLWEYTCLEVFIKDKNSSQYLEFNFSPELHWNCFFFAKPRIELIEYMELEDVKQNITFLKNHYQHSISLNTSKLPFEFSLEGQRQIGLTAVIADTQNNLSYWALAHHGEKPDFHDPSGMIIEI